MKRSVTVVALLLCGASAFAQYKQKMDLQLQHFLAKEDPAEPEVSLFIHGDEMAVEQAVRRHGGRVTQTRPGLVAARVPAATIRALAHEQAVHHFEFSLSGGTLMNDSMRVKNRVVQVHSGQAPLPQGYDGTGVVFGIIDTGLDITHPDFRDENDQTRVYRYWDQVPQANAASPAPYGYGTEYVQEDLAGSGIPTDPQGHGTAVAGTACGNGLANGRHKGVAPKSDIIVVASRMGSVNWSATVADGVRYIFQQADLLGKPAVVNISMGSYSGSHDGKDAAALFIQDMLGAQNGRVLTAAAGNSHGTYPYHVRMQVDQDTSFTWFQTNEFPAAYNVFDFPNVFFEVWADAADLQNVQFAMGADRMAPSLNFRGHSTFRSVADVLGQTVMDPIISASGSTLGAVQYYAQERGDQIVLQVLVASPDTADCLWRFMSTGNGAFDIWSLTTYTRTANVLGPLLTAAWFPDFPFPTPDVYPAMAHFVEPDYKKHIVDSWACIPDVITVANYCNEISYLDYFGVPRSVAGTEQDISPSSSFGPTRDGRRKPDIASTGDVTFTAGPLEAIQWIIENQDGYKVDPGGKHIRDGGTSQAAPVVAGAAALYLQKCPNASAGEVAQAIRKSARSDQFTGPVPNDRWGMGKLDVYNALLNHTALQASATSFCEDGSVQVQFHGEATPVWSNGATGNPIQVSSGGSLSATSTTASGCVAYSDTLTFVELPLPPTPTVTVNGSTLTSSDAVAYQWVEAGQVIPEATTQAWTAFWPGSYQVLATDANGCSALSAAVQVLTVDVGSRIAGALHVWPSPVREELNIALPEHAYGQVDVVIFGADGKLVLHERRAYSGTAFQLSVNGLAPGTYTLTVNTPGERWNERFVKTR